MKHWELFDDPASVGRGDELIALFQEANAELNNTRGILNELENEVVAGLEAQPETDFDFTNIGLRYVAGFRAKLASEADSMQAYSDATRPVMNFLSRNRNKAIAVAALLAHEDSKPIVKYGWGISHPKQASAYIEPGLGGVTDFPLKMRPIERQTRHYYMVRVVNRAGTPLVRMAISS